MVAPRRLPGCPWASPCSLGDGCLGRRPPNPKRPRRRPDVGADAYADERHPHLTAATDNDYNHSIDIS